MLPVIAGFDWDDGNHEKCQRHGISIADIESLFESAVTVFPDQAHSSAEERFKAIGVSKQGRHIFIVFALRRRGNATLLRPISARYMHRKEVRHYEKEIAKAAQRQGG